MKKFKIDGKDVQKGEKEDNPIEIEGTGTVEILESDFIRKMLVLMTMALMIIELYRLRLS